MKNEPFSGIGRRKNSTARVYLSSGSGNFVVNSKFDLNSYLKRESLVIHAMKPLEILNLQDKYDGSYYLFLDIGGSTVIITLYSKKLY